MDNFTLGVILGAALLAGTTRTQAQVNASDSVMNHAKGNKLSVGGYGEVAYSRNFYSDHVSRYTLADEHKNDPSHGRFDIPHAVVYLGYDFGKGWTMGTEIEFEHAGTGVSYEKENEEGGEWEQETEKGGEVELEQFWLQKSFWGGKFNIRAGHIVVPVGLNNTHHEPLNFFTVYRPEGENTILPSTWHQTGISFWGKLKDWRYEAQILAGLNADHFTHDYWIHKGASSPLEFDVANKYALALRIDNYSVKGLRLGLSGYCGNSIGNTYPNDAAGASQKYKGTVLIGSFDFSYNAHNWIVRGQADYGYLGDAAQLKYFSNRRNKLSPYHHTPSVSKNAFSYGIEAGYDVFSQIQKLRDDHQKLYVFGRFEQYNPYASKTNNENYDYTAKKNVSFGINYYPLPQIVVKADYSCRILKSQYNNEPSINIGIAYAGFFL